jgi:hypothetical protein
MNELWERAISDLTLEQVNHHERDGVLPIAFSFSHYIQAQDQSISVIFGEHPPLWAAMAGPPRLEWRLTRWVARRRWK